ncbi:MAG: hypothetical protein M3Z14_04660 [Candidatus Eremiobacteraeota bacterium]|nr:hypothetical protein [Candidatus Eremiobacteraeota bacterium]
MKRSRARPGDVSSARKVLKDLDNPSALKRNPLAAPWFRAANVENEREVARRLRARVLDVVKDLQPAASKAGRSRVHALRQYAIITRYDLNGESLDAVVTALGIGQSKFYYERRAALSKIAEGLRYVDSASGVEILDIPSDVKNAERYAAKLADVGQISLAISTFRKLVHDAQSPKQRVVILSKLIKVLFDAGRIQEGRLVLNELKATSQNIRPNEFFDVLIAAQLGLAELQLAWYDGDSSRALSLAKKSLDLLRRYSGPSDESLDLTFALHASWLGSILLERGEVEVAIEAMTQALNHAERAGASAHQARVVLLPNLANAQSLSLRHIGNARRTNREALFAAARDCSLQVLCQAHINQTMLDYWMGQTVSALAHARQAHDIALLACGPIEQHQVSLLLARAESLNGYSRRALIRVAETRSNCAENSYLWNLSQMIEAEILNALGRHNSALKFATAAVDSLRRSANNWSLASALCIQAETYEFLHLKSDALEAISAAIPSLEGRGNPWSLFRAFACSGRLTKNLTHFAYAHDLMKAISS